MIRRVYMVVSCASEKDLNTALGVACERLSDAGDEVLFCVTRAGYAGEFEHIGADPSSWGPTGHCTFCAHLKSIARCRPDCAGWFIDEAAAIRACDRCFLVPSDGDAGEHVEHLLVQAAHDSIADGWSLFWSGDGPCIQRDDEAAILASDDDALPLAIAKLNALTSCNVGPRETKRTP